MKVVTEAGTKLWINRGMTDPESNCETFLLKPCPHAMDSAKTRFTKSLIIIIIRAMQALGSFQCKAKAPQQSGVVTLLLQIWGFLQFSSTKVLNEQKNIL